MERAIIVLLLEDDPTHASLIKKELHAFDGSIVVEQVLSTEECFDLLARRQKYNLIILNYDLPQKNGIEVVRKIREEYRFRKPIISLIGPRHEGFAEDVIKAGATRYIIKTENYHSRLATLVRDCLKTVPAVKDRLREYQLQAAELIHFIIDEQEVEGVRGETVLEVAARYGISIPTLCYHPSVSTFGACRICVVEVKQRGRTKLHPSCVFPISEGIEVKTASERVLKARRMLLELLMARCPEAKLIKEMGEELGLRKTRFKLNEDSDKCILCGLCVRICEEVVGVGAIGFSQRGLHREISTPFLELSDSCTGCGECAKICPTEAITLEYIDEKIRKERRVVAVKCDGCAGYDNRACVINCPTGALEVMPIEDYLSKHKMSFNIELRELLKESLEGGIGGENGQK